MGQIPAVTATPSTPTGFANLAYSQLTGAAASITFSGLSTSYKEFIHLAYVTMAAASIPIHRLNADSGANYDYQGMKADALTVTNLNGTGVTKIYPTGGSGAEPTWTLIRMTIYKNAAGLEGMVFTRTAYPGYTLTPPSTGMMATRWNNTADLISGISTLTYDATNLAAGTAVTLFGLIP